MTISDSVTVGGALTAAVFFLWKLFTGWLIINLQVSIDLKRQSYDGENDILAVQINLKKGSTDTLWIRDISLRVTPQWPADKPTVITFAELTQLAIVNKKLDWEAACPEAKNITLSPDESVQFARAILVPRNRPALVEAAVFGDRTFWSKGFQWRASAVALPIVQNPAV